MAIVENNGERGARPGALPRVVNQTSSVQSKVADAIREAILTGSLRPGHRLIQREICEQTGASRAAVREALSALTAEGLVEHVPQRGMVVPLIGQKKAAEVYELRAALEGLAAQLYVERADANSREVLRGALAEIEKAVSESDERAFLLTKDRFYHELVCGAANEELRTVLTRLRGRIALLRSLTVSHPGRLEQSIDDLRRLMECIDTGDAHRAAEIAVMHVRSAGEAAQRVIEKGLQQKVRRLTSQVPDGKPA